MTSTLTSDLTIQVNPELITAVQPILDNIGLSVSGIVNLLLHQICLKHRIPFEISDVQLTEAVENEMVKFIDDDVYDRDILISQLTAFGMSGEGNIEVPGGKWNLYVYPPQVGYKPNPLWLSYHENHEKKYGKK